MRADDDDDDASCAHIAYEITRDSMAATDVNKWKVDATTTAGRVTVASRICGVRQMRVASVALCWDAHSMHDQRR